MTLDTVAKRYVGSPYRNDMEGPLVPSRDAEQFNLRLPEGMRARIAKLAKANMRSMNSEIVLILAQALGFSQGTTVAGASLPANPATVPNEPTPIGSSTHGL